MRFAILTTVARVTDATLERIARAAAIRLSDLDAAWCGIYSDLLTPMQVRICSAASELKDDDVPMLFVPTLDDPDALAYHDIRDTHPYGLILASDDQAIPSVEQAALHEILECRLDPSCNLYASGVAIEACDPVQDDAMPVDIGTGDPVPCSPFVLPAYFKLGQVLAGTPTNSAGLPLDALGVRPGGYCILQDGQERFGAGYVAKPHHGHWHSRPSRRRRARGGR